MIYNMYIVTNQIATPISNNWDREIEKDGIERMKVYVYYATGETVENIRFLDNNEAWQFVFSHGGYDCVVERYEVA